MGETADGLAPPSDLTAVEGRVVGCLIEKERATPQNYPLTLNSLRLACNQSTNRDPVVDYDDHEVEAALTSLRARGLTRIVYSPSNRASKYRHVLDENLRVSDAELAALCVLLLRGPQTLGEIKGRTERLYVFRDLAEVEATLDALAGRETGALARRIERRPGQKDARYQQLLTAGSSDTNLDTADVAGPSWSAFTPDDGDRDDERDRAGDVHPEASTPAPHDIDALRTEIEDLREELRALRTEFDAFRAAFE